MNRLPDDAPVRGVFVMLDGVRYEFPRANRWRTRHPEKGIRPIRETGRYSFKCFAEFERFDMVGYMGDPA